MKAAHCETSEGGSESRSYRNEQGLAKRTKESIMQISIYGILFVVSVILILILISIQYTLNLILKELREVRSRLGYGGTDPRKVREKEL